MTQLKSLAHPGWPYAGTAHEWRGFVKDEKKEAPGLLVAVKNGHGEHTFEPGISPPLNIFQYLDFGEELP